MFVINYVSSRHPLFLTYVWPSAVCVILTVIADKRATAQLTVVTKTCSSFSPALRSTNYPFCSLGNVMVWLGTLWKDWPTKALLICLMWSANHICWAFTEQRKYVFVAQRIVRNEEDKTLFSLGRSAESFVVSLLSHQLVSLSSRGFVYRPRF